MRVLHIITTINRGGAENHLYTLVEAQRKCGLDVSVAYLKGNGYWAEKFSQLGVDVINLNMKFYGDLRSLYILGQFIYKKKPDIVHAHMPPAELYTRCALVVVDFFRKIPFIISKHNDEPFMRLPGSTFVARWVSNRAGYLIAISEAVRRYFILSGIAKESRIRTIHYGLSQEPYDAVTEDDIAGQRHEWSAGIDSYVIGTVARLVPQKSIDTLLKGFALYKQCSNVSAKLVLVGSGPLEGNLKKLSDSLGIERDVVWAGFKENIPAVMRSFDVFALTSIYEGFGLVLLEAMSARIPVVASQISAIPEIVVDGESGILVLPERPDLVAQAFHRLENQQMRKSCGEAGYCIVKDYFTVDVMVQKTLDIYDEFFIV